MSMSPQIKTGFWCLGKASCFAFRSSSHVSRAWQAVKIFPSFSGAMCPYLESTGEENVVILVTWVILVILVTWVILVILVTWVCPFLAEVETV